jgi:hypothetical protein
MGVLNPSSNRRRTNPEAGATTLGIVERSVGYLAQGYKDATLKSIIQRFNCITGVGTLVSDTGYQRWYQAGVTGNAQGYYSINNTFAYNRFNYSTLTSSAAFTTPKSNSVTVNDLNLYTQAWILCTDSPGWAGVGVTDYQKVNLATETPVSRGNLSSGPTGFTRQGCNSATHGFFLGYTDTTCYILNFSTEVVTSVGGSPDSGMQLVCGMSVTNNKGYWVGLIPYNIRMSFTSGTVSGFASATAYTYHFGESHSLVNNTFGFMFAGYYDTTGRYGGTQHALCQRMTLATESMTTMSDLVEAQSSGQMMQGF